MLLTFNTITYRSLDGQGRLIFFRMLQVLKKCFSCLYNGVKQFFMSRVKLSAKEIVTLNTDYTQYSTCDTDDPHPRCSSLMILNIWPKWSAPPIEPCHLPLGPSSEIRLIVTSACYKYRRCTR